MNPLVQSALEGFACVAGAEGETERAGRLWGAAQALHEAKCIPRDIDFLAEADARISAVRLGMGEEAWEEAWRKRQMRDHSTLACELQRISLPRRAGIPYGAEIRTR